MTATQTSPAVSLTSIGQIALRAKDLERAEGERATVDDHRERREARRSEAARNVLAAQPSEQVDGRGVELLRHLFRGRLLAHRSGYGRPGFLSRTAACALLCHCVILS